VHRALSPNGFLNRTRRFQQRNSRRKPLDYREENFFIEFIDLVVGDCVGDLLIDVICKIFVVCKKPHKKGICYNPAPSLTHPHPNM